jgi:hypothetical protein
MKKINTLFYTKGHFGKGFREIIDTDNEFLYSRGHYPTKLKKEDLPEDYIEFQSRVIWYMTGYLKTSGVVDIGYKAMKINHLFKDAYLYISYKEKLKFEANKWGSFDCTNYDITVCGNCIVPILLYIEKYSNVDTTEVRNKILDKVKWFKENCKVEYNQFFGDKEIDIFKYYNDRINKKIEKRK